MMKKSILLFAACLILLNCDNKNQKIESNKNGESAQVSNATTIETDLKKAIESVKLFPFESAKIVFDYSVGEIGDKTIYIAEWGKKILTIDNRVFGGNNIGKTVFYLDGQVTGWSHHEMNMNNAKKAYSHSKPDADTDYLIANVLHHSNLLSGNTRDQLKQAGFEFLGEKEIVGKTCEGYKQNEMDVEVWRWNNIDLKVRNFANKISGFVYEAISFQENIEFPDDKCQIPEGFTIDE